MYNNPFVMERYPVTPGTIMNSHSHTTTTILVPPPSLSFPLKQTIHRHPTQENLPDPKGGTTELSIFSADRYFNEDVTNKTKQYTEHETPVMTERSDLSYTRDSSVSSSADGYGGDCREDRFCVASTASSRASWNSQSGLLRNPPGNAAGASRALLSCSSASPTSQERKKALPLGWLFWRSCPCSNKRSVKVKQIVGETKNRKQLLDFESADDGSSLSVGSKQGVIVDRSTKPASVSVPKLTVTSSSGDSGKERDAFTFLCLNHYSIDTTSPCPARICHRIFNSGGTFATETGNFSFPVLTKSSTTYDPPRHSLEVFCPRDDTNVAAVFSQQRTSTKPKTTRRSFTFQGNPNVSWVLDDDVASDSSSDLFEIDSFSTTMTSGPTYRRRDSLDEILAKDPRHFLGNAAGILHLQGVEEAPRPSNDPSECYPPSEVSIQWSVITAEGFDKSSLANFSSAASDYEEMSTFVVLPEKDVVGKKRGGLLSCRSEKAVNVGPNPVRCLPDQKRAIGNGGVGKERPPLLAKSYSARMTRPIQTK